VLGLSGIARQFGNTQVNRKPAGVSNVGVPSNDSVSLTDAPRQRLELANQISPAGFHPKEIGEITWKMAKGREYQNAKCEYGSSDDETEYFTVAIPGLRLDYVNINVGISNGEMMFRR
jgi:hypothetical protein